MPFSELEIREFDTEAKNLLNQAENSLLALDGGTDFMDHYVSMIGNFRCIKKGASLMQMKALKDHMQLLENTLTEQKSQECLSQDWIDYFRQGINSAGLLLKGEAVKFDHRKSVKIAATKILGRVIVLDDEEDIVEILSSVLRRENYEVLGLTDSTKLMAEVETFSPDMIFSDISMPKMSGLQVLAHIKVTHPEIPVVFISGRIPKDELVQGVGLGLFALIEKPFDIREVVQICEKAVKQHQSSKIRFSDLDEFLSSRRTSLKIT